jgi:hypothetical protein
MNEETENPENDDPGVDQETERDDPFEDFPDPDED